MLFASACALGEAAGCTNRAAHLRNDMDEGDPLQRLSADQLASCHHRSFKIACDKNDAWGCAMLGQSHRYGEGVRRNMGAARRSYRKACDLAPDFAACGFARADLEEMKSR
jgi:TPR repeat protein